LQQAAQLQLLQRWRSHLLTGCGVVCLLQLCCWLAADLMPLLLQPVGPASCCQLQHSHCPQQQLLPCALVSELQTAPQQLSQQQTLHQQEHVTDLKPQAAAAVRTAAQQA
jgi:hypothetical protein